ncbi:MAG: UDP-N-acetylglucosamine 2-epimerase (non-hydrolyzing) [Bacteroidales bacterium]|nr:UDP-N-acetylglucosamine 2-epimerase (non-hydrolyzing) [Bacteroidales bacterium]
MIKLLSIIGARPQIIKAAALSRAIRNEFTDKIEEIIVHTGQHYDENMSKVFFEELKIPMPNYNLNVGSGKHGEQSAKMITGVEKILLKENPNYIVLYGDTNSTLAGAVAASKINIPIVHIESGLRSFNKKMPEEINRIICDHCSSYLFSPTQTGFKNLINEGFKKSNKPYHIDNPGIFNYGDIMYDNSIYFSDIAENKSKILEKLKLKNKDFLLATVHRDYNTDNDPALIEILQSFNYLTKKYKNEIVFPIHPRTLQKIKSQYANSHIAEFLNNNLIHKIAPVSFFDMILLEKHARLILTDSGGVQKEAYFFNKPCIILRPETEWLEILETKKAILVSSSFKEISNAYTTLIESSNSVFPKIFGNGNAAELICKELLINS